MFVHLNQVQQVIEHFDAISKFQVVVDRIDFRDRIVLNLELTEAVSDKKELEKTFGAKFKDICRIIPDQVGFMDQGQLGEEGGELVDKREY